MARSKTSNKRAGEVLIPPLGLAGSLSVPDDAKRLVIFVHGSGSSRFSPRNGAVASALNRQGMATLLFDLLTPEEEQDRRNVFDIPLLASRLIDTIMWVKSQQEISDLPPLPVWREHRRGSRTDCSGRAWSANRGGRLAGWTAGSRGPRLKPGCHADTSHCGRPGFRCHRAQPGGAGPARRTEGLEDHSRRDASLPGARGARSGD